MLVTDSKVSYKNKGVLTMLKNLRIVKWEQYGYKGNELITKYFIFSKGQYKGLQFSISGLGLSKAERNLFDKKFLQFDENINIYIGKLIITYNSKGSYNHLKNVNIYNDLPVSYIVKYNLKNNIGNIKQTANSIKESIIRKLKFKEQYNFTMIRSWEGAYSFNSDILSAFQLASNYEACLYLNNKLIFSPLGFEWAENNKLLKKYTGLKYKNLGYKNPYDVEIKNYKPVLNY